jgi:hypothetical protein
MHSKIKSITEYNLYLIYGLTSSFEPDHIRYVGRSSSGLSRPRSHLQSRVKRTQSNVPLYKWILDTENSSGVINIVVLESTTRNCLRDKEIFWEHKLKSEKHNLLNVMPCGGGNRITTAEDINNDIEICVAYIKGTNMPELDVVYSRDSASVLERWGTVMRKSGAYIPKPTKETIQVQLKELYQKRDAALQEIKQHEMLIEEMRKLYFTDGYSIDEIAADNRFGYKPSNIRRLLQQFGTLRTASENLRKLSTEEIKIAGKLYQTYDPANKIKYPWNVNNLGKKFGVHGRTIARSLKRLGIPIRGAAVSLLSFTPEQELDICNRYNNGESTYKIGNSMGRNRNVIGDVLKRHNIQQRSHRDAYWAGRNE